MATQALRSLRRRAPHNDLVVHTGAVELREPADDRVRPWLLHASTYEDGDLVIAWRDRAIDEGEVAVFETPTGDVVIHRVVGVHGEHVITRGDNCSTLDAWPTTSADVRGTARRVVVLMTGGVAFAARLPLRTDQLFADTYPPPFDTYQLTGPGAGVGRP